VARKAVKQSPSYIIIIVVFIYSTAAPRRTAFQLWRAGGAVAARTGAPVQAQVWTGYRRELPCNGRGDTVNTVCTSICAPTILFLYITRFFPSFFSAARRWLLDFRIRFFSALSLDPQPLRPTNTSTHTRVLPVTRSFFLTRSLHPRPPYCDRFSTLFLARSPATATTTGHAVDRVNIPPPWEPLAGRKNKPFYDVSFFLVILLLLLFFFLITRFTRTYLQIDYD